MRKIFCIILTALFGICSFAQNDKKLFKEARKAFEFDHYRKATRLYEQLMQLDSNNALYLYNYGICNLMSFDYQHGLSHLQTALEKDPSVDKYADYWLGRAYHLNYNFSDAIHHYRTYLNTLKRKDSRRGDMEKLILEAEHGFDFCSQPSPYKVKNIGGNINTDNSEHSPITSQDGKMMIFTSRRYHEEEENADFDRVGHDGEYFERIFVTFKLEDGDWTEPKPIIGLEDVEDAHQATVELYDNDSKMLIYRDNDAGDIYVSSRINDTTWTTPEELKNVNTVHREADAYVSFDGSKMFISSSSDNLEHDLDLYYCDLVDNEWSKPKSVGDNINTSYDENSPFISKDGTIMYFSSKGHTSMGGYDVFRSDFDTVKQEWSIPQNVGHPINTPGDDIYFYYSNKNAWNGYFSSYRAGGFGEKDLYEVTFVPNAFINGFITNKETGEPLNDLMINFVSHSNEDLTGYVRQEVSTAFSRPEDARYDINLLSDSKYLVYVLDNDDTLYSGDYEIAELQEGDELYYTHNIEIDFDKKPEIITKEPILVKKDSIINDPGLIDTEIVIADVEVIKDTVKYFNLREEDIKTGCRVVLRNVYFDFDKATLKLESFEEINNLLCLLNDRPDIKIEISGHTDKIGPDQYNLNLSSRRAAAIVKYLVERGVAKNRLVSKGYGEKMPLASNDDEIEGRELNRRTEFLILFANPPALLSFK